MTCPCGCGDAYETCCGLYHSGTETAPTAESLMRSRYCAFVKQEIGYLKNTTWPAYQKYFDETGYAERASNSIWLGLSIDDTEDGGVYDIKGTVTFMAKSMTGGQIHEQREKSLFKKKQGQWYYVKAVE